MSKAHTTHWATQSRLCRRKPVAKRAKILSSEPSSKRKKTAEELIASEKPISDERELKAKTEWQRQSPVSLADLRRLVEDLIAAYKAEDAKAAPQQSVDTYRRLMSRTDAMWKDVDKASEFDTVLRQLRAELAERYNGALDKMRAAQ